MAPTKRPTTDRPSPSTGQSSSSSSSFPLYRNKIQRRLLTGLKFYIISAKLTAEVVEELVQLVEINGGRMVSVEKSDIIITAIGMRVRLERHVRWDIAVRSYQINEPHFTHFHPFSKTKSY